jgi:hypothetical protein
VDADWSVELGADDPALEFPWSSPDGAQGYVDLLAHPERLREIPEAARYPELAEVLLAFNSASSSWLTAKCDVWSDEDLGEAEEIYDSRLKMCSYTDLVRRYEATGFSFAQHEQWVKRAARQLSDSDEQPIACELTVRRCWFRQDSQAQEDSLPGFCITVFVFGYGDDEAQARARWTEGLRRVTAVLTGLRA